MKIKSPQAPFSKGGVRFRKFPPLKKGARGISLFVFASLLSVFCQAADPNPPRLYFSDASISFTFPNHWELEPKFPFGPLFIKPTKDGSNALISCAISAPLNNNQMSADISQEVLKQLAQQELASRQQGYRFISDEDKKIADHNAYEVVWENKVGSETLKHQTLYFFVESRIYALSLQTPESSFKWLVTDFQHWVDSVRILSRQKGAVLADPSHGGIWIHQTGGAKIALASPWLIGVADDRQLGAAYAQDDLHTEFTATVDASSTTDHEFAPDDRKAAIKSIRKKGLRIAEDKMDAFHGLPSYTIHYEGAINNRVIKGMDIWVLSPKGRWLFNLEGDVSLYNSLSDSFQELLKTIEFL